jgi:hypothetical protein
MKSILTFEKWTKINVQNRHVKNTLTEKNFCLENENLWCQIKPKYFFYNSIFFYFFCEKEFRNFFYYHYMVENGSNLVPKSSKKFYCELCDYSSCKKSQYDRHLLTDKHKKRNNGSNMVVNGSNLVPKSSTGYECECGKIYKHNSGYYRHKKMCKNENKVCSLGATDKELILMLIKDNSALKDMLFEQQSLMMKVIENGTNNTTNNTITNTNSNNKAFNLNFFLNETCKNAMNITDFVDSIKLQLSDLIEVGELGYVEGISKIIVKNLNNLDETVRPVHCTDKKRETMYIKDEGQWEKEDEKKSKLKKVITKVADKNIKLLPAFREKYPEYKNSASKTSDKYDKMVIEVMTCDDGKNEKIIKNISKATTIKD